MIGSANAINFVSGPGCNGHSVNLSDTGLQHGVETFSSPVNFSAFRPFEQDSLIAFLNSLVLFPPDDPASSIDPTEYFQTNFLQFAYGGIQLTVLPTTPPTSSRQ
jgi:hypothetical protein